MPDYGCAWDLLSLGDAIRARASQDRTTIAVVAADAGLTTPVATKAAWLARVYDTRTRRRIGRSVLGRLTPMHLEVVAAVPRELRDSLIRRAAADSLAARDLRALVRTGAARSRSPGTADNLVQSTRAMEVYAAFDDRSLRTLIDGPNGPTVRRAASAGRTLAARIAEFSSS